MMDENFKGISIDYLDFDIYSKSIGFFYNDKERIGSLFGFVLTVIYMILTLCLFIYYTLSTIKKSDIKVHDSLLYQKEAPEMNIDTDLFYFAFGVENYLTGYTRFIDETIYYPEVFFVNKIKEGTNFKTIENRHLNIERCKVEKFGKDYQNLLVNGELNNSYCIEDLNLTLAGNFKYNKLSYIKINIYPCVNSTKNNYHCKPKNIIDKFLSGTFISVLAKDIGLEPSNYVNPIVPQFQDIYVTIDKNFFRDFVVFYGITEIQTDEGLFFEDVHKKRYINFMKTTQGIYYQDELKYNNGESMCEIQIRMGDDIRIQKRTYRKMSEVFAITGGYMQLISTIFSIITFITNKIDQEVQLVNSLFNFYPYKKKISLKNQLKNLSANSSISHRINSFQKNRIPSFSLRKRNDLGYDSKKNNLIGLNHENSVISMDVKNKKYMINRNVKNMNIIYMRSKKEKDSSNDESNNNKSKVEFLTFGVSPITNKKKKNIFKNSFIIKKKESIIEDVHKREYMKKEIKFNSLYYYCFSKFKNNSEDKEIIKLFNFAITFYKQKLNIIYFFYIILLIEKILETKKDTFIDDEVFFNLNDN